jgi:hypothetical protein
MNTAARLVDAMRFGTELSGNGSSEVSIFSHSAGFQVLNSERALNSPISRRQRNCVILQA